MEGGQNTTGVGWVTLGTQGAGVSQFDEPGAIFVDAVGRILAVSCYKCRYVM